MSFSPNVAWLAEKVEKLANEIWKIVKNERFIQVIFVSFGKKYVNTGQLVKWLRFRKS